MICSAAYADEKSTISRYRLDPLSKLFGGKGDMCVRIDLSSELWRWGFHTPVFKRCLFNSFEQPDFTYVRSRDKPNRQSHVIRNQYRSNSDGQFGTFAGGA
jgi:hypothetical protein